MKLSEVAKACDLEIKVSDLDLNRDVSGGYAGDLLSDVIANSKKGDIWITLQIHQNIIAVATLKELAGIVIIGGKEPAAEILEKAKIENVPILTSSLTAFELIGRLYELGIRGNR